MSDKDKTIDWKEYYKNKSNQIPRDSLLKALEIIKKEKKTFDGLFAIDLGCGHGSDTIELLKQGWKVDALDSSETGLSILNEDVDADLKKNLRTKKMSFENIELEQCDLINASYSLPFCKPENFKTLWGKIVNAIKKGGIFSGQLFGEKDEWAENRDLNFHNARDVQKMFSDFEILYFEEKDEDGTTASGDSKHWHVFTVVAKKLV